MHKKISVETRLLAFIVAVTLALSWGGLSAFAAQEEIPLGDSAVAAGEDFPLPAGRGGLGQVVVSITAEPSVIPLGISYDLLQGVTAQDETGTDVLVTIESDGGFDVDIKNTYIVAYTADHPSTGESFGAERTVTVYPFAPQPQTIGEVQAAIDAWEADMAEKPHWQTQVDENLMPDGWRCDSLEDEVGGVAVSYWSVFPAPSLRMHQVTSASTLQTALTGAVDGDVIQIMNDIQMTEKLNLHGVDQRSLSTITIESGTGKEVTIYAAPGQRHLEIKGIVSSSGSFQLIFDQKVVLDGNDAGGGIRVDVSVTSYTTIKGAIIKNCRMLIQKGGAIYATNTLIIEKCKIFDNYTTKVGGGVFALSSIEVKDCDIYRNKADNADGEINGFGGGGGIYVQGGMLSNVIHTISSSRIYENSAPYGGGIFVYNNNTVVTNCKIYGNKATIQGGGIHLLTNSPVITLNLKVVDCQIFDNTADGDGGGIHLSRQLGGIAANLETSNCEIYHNTAGGNGGGISGFYVKADGCQIYDNTADGDGGGIIAMDYAAARGRIQASDCDIYHNAADGDGGGLHAHHVKLANCLISGNIAGSDGGGMKITYFVGSPFDMPEVTNCQIWDNTAGGDGGGINISNITSTNLLTDSNTTFSGNKAANTCDGDCDLDHSHGDDLKLSYPNIDWSGAPTSHTHPLNNQDINFPLTIYQIQYRDGATPGTTAPQNIAKEHRTARAKTAEEAGISTPAGKTFLEWNTSPDGTGIVYQPNGAIDVSGANGNIVLYAQWSTNIYTVTFDENYLGAPKNDQTASYGDTIHPLPQPANRTGYDFLGWNAQPDGSGSDFLTTTPVEGDIVLYAQWARKSYTVTFDENYLDAPKNHQTALYGNTIDPLPQPARTGHTFGGWFPNADGSGVEFADTTLVTGDTTIYARWIPIRYKVTFDLGYTGATPSPYAVVEADYDTNLVGRVPGNPSRDGYKFQAWFTQEGIPFTDVTAIRGDITVYAHWGQNFTVLYEQNYNGAPPATAQIVEFPAITVEVLPSDPSRIGHTFQSWNTQKDGSGTQFIATTPITASLTVYAQWKAIDYTVTFNSNGNDIVASQSVPYGSKAINPGTLKRPGYMLDGWYGDALLASPWNFDTNIVTEDITLYAKWTYQHGSDDGNGSGSKNPPVIPPVTPPTPGSGDGRGTDPNVPRSSYTPIGDQPVPLVELPYTDILDDNVPLVALPQTGDERNLTAVQIALVISGVCILLGVITHRRKQKQH